LIFFKKELKRNHGDKKNCFKKSDWLSGPCQAWINGSTPFFYLVNHVLSFNSDQSKHRISWGSRQTYQTSPAFTTMHLRKNSYKIKLKKWWINMVVKSSGKIIHFLMSRFWTTISMKFKINLLTCSKITRKVTKLSKSGA
jgi:hypothetical protein